MRVRVFGCKGSTGGFSGLASIGLKGLVRVFGPGFGAWSSEDACGY